MPRSGAGDEQAEAEKNCCGMPISGEEEEAAAAASASDTPIEAISSASDVPSVIRAVALLLLLLEADRRTSAFGVLSGMRIASAAVLLAVVADRDTSVAAHSCCCG